MSDPDARRGPPLRILVVDDQPEVAAALAELLALAGHAARAVCDGAQAVVAAAADRPDVALVDLAMPRLDGFGVAPWLRAQVPAVRLVAVTGVPADGAWERCAAAGFEALLVKPVTLADLERVLDRGPATG